MRNWSVSLIVIVTLYGSGPSAGAQSALATAEGLWQAWSRVQQSVLDLEMVGSTVLANSENQSGWVLAILEDTTKQVKSLETAQDTDLENHLYCEEPTRDLQRPSEGKSNWAHFQARMSYTEWMVLETFKKSPHLGEPLQILLKNCAASMQKRSTGPDCCEDGCAATSRCVMCSCVPPVP